MKENVVIIAVILAMVMLIAGALMAATDVFVVNPLSVKSAPTTSIKSGDYISTGNSTTTLLASGETFTGAWVSTIGYASIQSMVYSDVVGSTSGFQFQFSGDGVNVDYVSRWSYDASHITAGIAHFQTVPARGAYVRIVYTNGPTPQGVFRLSTVFRFSNSTSAIMDVDNVVLDHHQAQLVKAVLTGHSTAQGGAYVDVKVNPSGAFTVDASNSSVSAFITGSSATLRTIITDTSGAELDYRHENENWNSGDHGILTFGRDQDTNPNKYRALHLDPLGSVYSNSLFMTAGTWSYWDGRVYLVNSGGAAIAAALAISDAISGQNGIAVRPFNMLYDRVTGSWFRSSGTITGGADVSVKTITTGTSYPVTVIPWVHTQIHAGNLYRTSQNKVISAATYTTFNVFISAGGSTIYHFGYALLSSDVTCTTGLYEDATNIQGSGITAVTSYNKSRGSALATGLTASADNVGSTAPTGTLIQSDTLAPGQRLVHPVNEDEFMLKAGSRYCLSTACVGTTSNRFNWEFTWYPQ